MAPVAFRQCHLLEPDMPLRPRHGALVRALPTVLTLLLAACGGADIGAPMMAKQDAAPTTRPLAKNPDHHEFEAQLVAPFTSNQASGGRVFSATLDFPGAETGRVFAWSLQLLSPAGEVVQQWSGESAYAGQPVAIRQAWAGRSGVQLGDGVYRARLEAVALGAADAAAVSGADRVAGLLSVAGAERQVQQWDFVLGSLPQARLPAFAPLRTAADAGRAHALSVGATGGLPYTVYYADLHSQTNDSDGGGAISSCSSSQPAQTGAYGPPDAFAYGKAAGLDILMASEHNHYFDGSSGTNASADPTVAHNRYQAGLTAASNFTAANPGFLAVYGMEWGVISNGGHMNIFNSNELFGWEYNSSNQLIADRLTPKSDYAAIYSTMRTLGLVGQFNHPDTVGQFTIGGTDLAYSADGDEVMVLAEVLNSSAFSNNTTETETALSNFEAAFNILLERGYHVAPATNQDNHCANWGKSYTNRTGVLIPSGTALSKTSFLDAIKARRVFASMDKNSQIVLTANGHLMGERFSNSGALNLSVGYANTAGRTAATVQILEGVPKRNGTVSVLASSGTASVTPALGDHYYYAKITQDDGKILWSAPLWVTQTSGGTVDTTPPTASASESGSAGTITLSATASDNVGVTRVDFLVDSVVKGSATTAPYSMTLDSTTLANGSHSLVARAYDAAGNSGASSSVAFSISNAGATLNETESNGTIASANVVTNQTTITGTMGSSTDKDFFKVTLAAKKTLKVDMVCPSQNDYDLYLVNSSGTTLKASESASCVESVSYTNGGTTSMAVYIKVISYSGSSTTQPYTLTLSYP
jgi:hypothetical protein